MEITLAEICRIVNGKLDNSEFASLKVDNISGLADATPNQLSFLHNLKYSNQFYQTKAGAVLVSHEFVAEKQFDTILIRVSDVYASLVLLLEVIENQNRKVGIEEPVYISSDVTIGKNVYIGAFAYIGKGSSVADNVMIYPNTYIGENVTINDNTILYAGAKVYAGSRIGKNCILHSGCVVGSDGFGHAPLPDGTYKKIPQIGNVIIHDNVEIGANTTVDRATIESTIINSGVKLDNLIMVAHNVEIGENTVIAALSGISGSTKIGKQCIVAGQVGFVGHIQVADGSRFGAKSGISHSVNEPNKDWLGAPIMPVKDALRALKVSTKLPEIYKLVYKLEKETEDIKKIINQNNK